MPDWLKGEVGRACRVDVESTALRKGVGLWPLGGARGVVPESGLLEWRGMGSGDPSRGEGDPALDANDDVSTLFGLRRGSRRRRLMKKFSICCCLSTVGLRIRG